MYMAHYCNAADVDLGIERFENGIYKIGKMKIFLQ